MEKLCKESIDILKEHWLTEKLLAQYYRQDTVAVGFDKWNKRNKRVAFCTAQLKNIERIEKETWKN